nr:type I DNA topoisomerase [Lachnospiraceae bacterium]
MAKYLVIVESPAKVKTIKKFLGSNYEVMASQGHVRDLPKSSLGIDIENDYEPKYITIRGKGELLAGLRKEAKKADKIYLATDPDREGEAISWHLFHALNLKDKKFYRITFNEITKNAVKDSLKGARTIDMKLVDAQQARRVLDRMVGYMISPLLWAKIKKGLSAGRVQSVALRIICDRENEIDAFIPEEYYTLDVDLAAGEGGKEKTFKAKYYGNQKGKVNLTGKEAVDKVIESSKNEKFTVIEEKKSDRTKKAPLPFTTSTLQQEAGKLLNYSTQKTMSLAQRLYEGVDIKGEGTVALISYLRTDSTRVSDEAEAMAKDFIGKYYGEGYYNGNHTVKNDKKKVQDAHEAIRPTVLERTPSDVKAQLPRDLYRLYKLIWDRFVASRMTPAIYDTVSVKIG